MTCEVQWADSARADVERAVRYIVIKLGSPSAASSLLDGFDKAIDELSAFPESHHIAAHPALASRGLRVKRARRHLMLYSYDGEAVIISRVLHSLQDYARIIEAEG